MRPTEFAATDASFSEIEARISDRTGFTLAQLVSIARISRPNILIVGVDAEADALITLLGSQLPPPVHSFHGRGDSELPRGGGRVVLENAAALPIAAQHALLEWFDSYPRSSQTIALARQPLWPLVKERRFLRRLFYRLNTLTLHVGPGPADD